MPNGAPCFPFTLCLGRFNVLDKLGASPVVQRHYQSPSLLVAEVVDRLGGDPLTLDNLRRRGLYSDAAQQVLIIERDLATWPPLRWIQIIELDGDTRCRRQMRALGLWHRASWPNRAPKDVCGRVGGAWDHHHVVGLFVPTLLRSVPATYAGHAQA